MPGPAPAPAARHVLPAAAGRRSGEEQVLEPDDRRLGRAIPTRRTASSTPGMNDVRSVESWRIVSVWPTSPRMTSWWATRPGQAHGVDRHVALHQLAPCAPPSRWARRACGRGAARRSPPWPCAARPRRRSASSARRRSRSSARRRRWRRVAPRRARARSKPGRPDDDVHPGAPRHASALATRRVGPGEVDDDVGAVEHVGERSCPAPGRRGRPARGRRRPRPPRTPSRPCGPAAPATATRGSCRPPAPARARPARAPRGRRPRRAPMPAALRRSGASSSPASSRRSSTVTASMRSTSSSTDQQRQVRPARTSRGGSSAPSWTPATARRGP